MVLFFKVALHSYTTHMDSSPDYDGKRHRKVEENILGDLPLSGNRVASTTRTRPMWEIVFNFPRGLAAMILPSAIARMRLAA